MTSNLGDRLQAEADHVTQCDFEQRARWNGGFTRRRFLQGVGMVGVAALGSQLVTSRYSFAAATPATAPTTQNTLIVMFLRGAADGLRMLVPASTPLGMPDLVAVRSPLIPATSQLIALQNGWAMAPAFQSLAPFWKSNELAFVPGVSIPGLQRSHFAAQALLEAGGVTSSTGWLDRTLNQLGPGTTFRAVSEGSATPASLAGPEPSLTIGALSNFSLGGGLVNGLAANQTAIEALYRGLDGYMPIDVPAALNASSAATQFAAAAPQNGAVYPAGNLSTSLQDIARMLHAEAGLEIATIDVGGWDTHTGEANEMDPLVKSLSDTLAAFMTDLGAQRRARVTVVVMTEFGRQVAMNANYGSDHGAGSVMMALGGGLKASGVYGAWQGLKPAVLAGGAVPMCNNAFDVFGELLRSRLSIGSLSTIFPGHSYVPLGMFA